MKRRFLFFALFVSSFLASCVGESGQHLYDDQVYFSSFKYKGNDSCFDISLLKEDQVFNPILSGSYTDASVCRKGDDFYMAVASYAYFPGIPVLHSKDLINWEEICHALPTEKQCLNPSLEMYKGAFAPTIRYNELEDMFYITSTFVGGGGHFVVKAKDPSGPWSDPQWLYGLGGVHSSLFIDDDQKAYLLNQGNPDYEPPYTDYKVIWAQEFDLGNQKNIGKRRIILAGGNNLDEKPVWLESPSMFKKDGYYYLVCSEGGSLGNGYSACVFRSKDFWGPYEAFSKNPILTQRRLPVKRENAVTNTGKVEMFSLPDGRWYAVFSATRPYNENNDNLTGRETFLHPITWEDGWPILSDKFTPVATIIEKPFKDSKYINDGSMIHAGNYEIEETFDGNKMPLRWFMLRTPVYNPLTPNKQKGITVPLYENNIRSVKHANFVALRQCHQNIEVETIVDFKPKIAGEFGGLAVFLTDGYNAIWGVRREGDKNYITIRKSVNAQPISVEDIFFKDITEEYRNRVYLKIIGNTNSYQFYYKFTKEQEWIKADAEIPSNYFSMNGKNLFMGPTLGLYASCGE